ncbi:MAG: DUF4434 domain-containing protein [Eubacteriaceae bacterium]|nr:DUF4434 domain-containing protein [Eubacteriaceae bacterium]
MRRINKTFSSSFIQPWFMENWDYNRWAEEFAMLKVIGIDEIIIQNTVDTYNKYAIYPTQIEGYSCSVTDVICTALRAAECTATKVRIGLGVNSGWWTGNTFIKSWLEAEASINKTIAGEINQLYGSHPLFGGWYIPYEFSQTTAVTKKQKANLNNFYRNIALYIRFISKDDIMVAPFYNVKYSFLCSISRWEEMLTEVLHETGIDILALQDSIGAGFNTMDELDKIFLYTKKAADCLKIKLYADTETFTAAKSGFIPAEQSRIEQQISVESKYVDKFTAFSIDHYQNRNTSSQIDNYYRYYNYYKNNK